MNGKILEFAQGSRFVALVYVEQLWVVCLAFLILNELEAEVRSRRWRTLLVLSLWNQPRSLVSFLDFGLVNAESQNSLESAQLAIVANEGTFEH